MQKVCFQSMPQEIVSPWRISFLQYFEDDIHTSVQLPL